MFITKKKHEAIVKDLLAKIDLFKQYEEMRKDNQKNNDKLVEILERLTDKIGNSLTASDTYGVLSMVDGGCELILPDHVPVYVEDVNGGKVIKQEATPVTILDENGKATYGLTKQAPDKGKKYQLIEKCKEF